MIDVYTVEGAFISRGEIFDEADLDAAIARFEELSRPTPGLENAATRTVDRVNAYFGARDWAALGAMMATDVVDEDRRHAANAGVRQGRDTIVGGVRTAADLGAQHIASAAIAIRGDRLALCRLRYSGRDQRPEAFHSEALGVVEIDVDERVVAHVGFDLDDFDAAIAELDARYLAGEAAAHSEAWLVIAEVYAALNRGEMPAVAPDLVDIDHRRLAAIGSGDLMAYLQAAAAEDAPRSVIYIETIHRLTDLGAVTTHAVKATSREGFDAEWRITSFFLVGGDRVNRYEYFDETDLDAALTRFDELHPQPPRLENVAAQAYARIHVHFAARDWDDMAEMVAGQAFHDDRRRGVGAEHRKGRDAVVAEFSALAEIGVKRMTSDTVAIRGSRLVLSRSRALGSDPRADAFRTEVLSIVELDADGRTAALVTFGPDDFDAARRGLGHHR